MQLAQLLPQRRMMIVYGSLLVIGSILAASATGAGMFIGGHILQGLFTSMLLIAAAPPLFLGFPTSKLRPTAVVLNLCIFGAVAAGPLVGGAILTHLSWRFMFWVNVPFCVAGLVLSAKYLPRDSVAAVRPKLDVLGFALLAPGIAALILGLSNAGTAAGFGHPGVIIPLTIGVALMLAFCLYAVRRSEPLADIRLLARRPVASCSASPGPSRSGPSFRWW